MVKYYYIIQATSLFCYLLSVEKNMMQMHQKESELKKLFLLCTVFLFTVLMTAMAPTVSVSCESVEKHCERCLDLTPQELAGARAEHIAERAAVSRTQSERSARVDSYGEDWDIDENGILWAYYGGGPIMEIPDGVIGIDEDVLYYNEYFDDILEIRLNAELEWIDEWAFSWMLLQAVIFNPDSSLQYIGDFCFYVNEISGEIEIPEGVTYIGNCSFDMNDIDEIIIPSTTEYCGFGYYGTGDNGQGIVNHHATITAIDGDTYITVPTANGSMIINKKENILCRHNGDDAVVVVPEGIEIIETEAFMWGGHHSLVTVLPTTLVELRENSLTLAYTYIFTGMTAPALGTDWYYADDGMYWNVNGFVIYPEGATGYDIPEFFEYQGSYYYGELEFFEEYSAESREAFESIVAMMFEMAIGFNIKDGDFEKVQAILDTLAFDPGPTPEEKIKELEEKIEDLLAQILAHEGTIESKDTLIAELQETIKELNKAKTDYLADIGELNDEIDVLNDRIKELEEAAQSGERVSSCRKTAAAGIIDAGTWGGIGLLLIIAAALLLTKNKRRVKA